MDPNPSPTHRQPPRQPIDNPSTTLRQIISICADEAIGNVLDNRKSPSRKVNEIDNRGTNFYLALYWAEAMAARGEHAFAALAKQLEANEASIVDDLIKCQGKPVDLGGYYHPDPAKIEVAMRPSKTFNDILEAK